MNTFEDYFAQRNPSHSFLIADMREALQKSCIEFSDINSVNLRIFRDYLLKKVAGNSVRTYMAVLKATCNELYNDGLIKSVKCTSVLKVKAEPQQNIDMTAEEMKRFENYYDQLLTKSGHQAEKDVLTLFLIECFTGARGIDVESFTEENVKDGVLSYVSKKTHTLTILPAHKRLTELIGRIPTREYSRMTKNRTIKRIAERIGITDDVTLYYHGGQKTMPRWKFLGFHSARRSYIGEMIDRGVPLPMVAKMAGHHDTKTTNRYYVRQSVELNEKAMAFYE